MSFCHALFLLSCANNQTDSQEGIGVSVFLLLVADRMILADTGLDIPKASNQNTFKFKTRLDSLTITIRNSSQSADPS